MNEFVGGNEMSAGGERSVAIYTSHFTTGWLVSIYFTGKADILFGLELALTLSYPFVLAGLIGAVLSF